MGLCKCPKRKVTNLFCFEHRVNVCEHCLVANHNKCIVQSYLHWLQDSDYDPSCKLCNQPLADGETVRLICYDVFHWLCINQYAKELPPNTAPAGYTCPTCQNGIFPPGNLVSPVAEQLRQILSQVNWARAGLGLPLIQESVEQDHHDLHDMTDSAPSVELSSNNTSVLDERNISQTSSQGSSSSNGPIRTTYSSVTTINMEETTPHARIPKDSSMMSSSHNTSMLTPTVSSPRKIYDATKEDKVLDMSHDHDADKYKRRTAIDWLSRWFKSTTKKRPKRDANSSFRKFAIVLVFGLIGFFTLVIIMTRAGRSAANDDPFLDPMANPNIRVARDVAGAVGP
ncbi:zinc finger protein-like 1 [Saccoglossus kowalevskii]|uniref:Zinc finger protein-like 1 n=1 Tax=Saccoglossus kowalevskii TaxID=10224 RepID=A0ABM0GGU7_SACKO|nr:zinc finger protein-like 1 [Saccoglossus kowalevskii]